MKEIIGFDTETFKGYVKVLANSNGAFIETSDSIELLDWLWHNSTINGYNVFYNINYDLASIIKPYIISHYSNINAKDIKESEDEDDDVGYFFNIGDFAIKFLTDKAFIVRYKHHSRYFWDASNFYKSGYGHISLDKASQQYLNKHKNDGELLLDREKIGSEEGYYEQHRNDIIKYCINDSILTKELFARTIQGYNNLGFEMPDKPFSEASVFKQYLLSRGWDDEIKASEQLRNTTYFNKIWQSYRGGLFRTFKVGRINDIYDIDINSAYPYALSKLYSIVGCKIIEGECPDCDYKFYHIKAYPNKFLPLKHNNRLYYGYSSRKFEWFITEWDKKLLDLYGYNYDILDQFGIMTNKKLVLKELPDLYNKKYEIKSKYGKNSVEYYNIKIMLNSGYGIFAQSQPTFTKFTNFVYASYITAFTRFKIGEFLKINPDNAISISTDGILFENNSSGKGLELMKSFESDKMGDISIEHYDYVIQYGNGIYLLVKDHFYQLKKRGFEQMTVNDLDSDLPFIEYKAYKPMRLIEAIIQKRYADINEFVEVKKIFSPFNIWMNANPEFAESLIDYTISDFKSLTLDVPEMNLDNVKWVME